MKGKAVVITRPAHLSGGLVANLISKGADVIQFPTIEIEYISDQVDLKSVFSDSPPDLGIFVSVNAVLAVGDWLRRNSLSWPCKMRCAGVGPATAQAAREAFAIDHVIAPQSGTGAKSLLRMNSMQDLSSSSIAVFQGETGSGMLQAEIGAQCRILSTYPVYRTVQPKTDSSLVCERLDGAGIDCVVLTSVTGARNFLSMLGPHLSGRLSAAVFVVYSLRIAEYLNSLGFANIRIARQASDEAIVEAIANEMCVKPNSTDKQE